MIRTVVVPVCDVGHNVRKQSGGHGDWFEESSEEANYLSRRNRLKLLVRISVSSTDRRDYERNFKVSSDRSFNGWCLMIQGEARGIGFRAEGPVMFTPQKPVGSFGGYGRLGIPFDSLLDAGASRSLTGSSGLGSDVQAVVWLVDVEVVYRDAA
jgi:hypothetical protein